MRIEVRKCMEWLELTLSDVCGESYWTETDSGLELWKVIIYDAIRNLDDLLDWLERHQQVALEVYNKLRSYMGGD